MAIQSNASTQEVMGGIKLYSGLSNFNVVAVNPTMEQLHAMDIKVKTEPNYFLELNGEDYFKVVFWIKNDDLTTRLEILMQNKARVSQNGKNQWINKIGQSTWAEGEPSMDWWKADGQRHCYVGEETLINFLKAWANVASGDEVTLDTIDKIVKGDTSELSQLIAGLKDNQVRLLIGVKDGKYQSVYTKCFGRIKPQRDDIFVRNLNDEYGNFNAEFNTDLQWGTFSPQLGVTTPDANGVEAAPFSNKEVEDWV